MLMFYLFLANDLGTRGGPAHGGFMKARLALVPPLIWLACLRKSAHMPIRFGFRALTMALGRTMLWEAAYQVLDGLRVGVGPDSVVLYSDAR
jgi:hypothetical protein